MSLTCLRTSWGQSGFMILTWAMKDKQILRSVRILLCTFLSLSNILKGQCNFSHLHSFPFISLSGPEFLKTQREKLERMFNYVPFSETQWTYQWLVMVVCTFQLLLLCLWRQLLERVGLVPVMLVIALWVLGFMPLNHDCCFSPHSS